LDEVVEKELRTAARMVVCDNLAMIDQLDQCNAKHHSIYVSLTP